MTKKLCFHSSGHIGVMAFSCSVVWIWGQKSIILVSYDCSRIHTWTATRQKKLVSTAERFSSFRVKSVLQSLGENTTGWKKTEYWTCSQLTCSPVSIKRVNMSVLHSQVISVGAMLTRHPKQRGVISFDCIKNRKGKSLTFSSPTGLKAVDKYAKKKKREATHVFTFVRLQLRMH